MPEIPLKNSDKTVSVSPRDAGLQDLPWELHSTGYAIFRRLMSTPVGQVTANKLKTRSSVSTRPRKRVAVYMHRLIMKPGSRQRVRFRDGNPLNCRRDNMFLVGPKD